MTVGFFPPSLGTLGEVQSANSQICNPTVYLANKWLSNPPTLTHVDNKGETRVMTQNRNVWDISIQCRNSSPKDMLLCSCRKTVRAIKAFQRESESNMKHLKQHFKARFESRQLINTQLLTIDSIFNYGSNVTTNISSFLTVPPWSYLTILHHSQSSPNWWVFIW